MHKIMLLYPPGEVYQRGEDRCQMNVSASVANSLRTCNDLGYISAILKQKGNWKIFLKDYSGENLTKNQFRNDFKTQNPDVVVISTTTGSIFSDIDFVNQIKSLKNDVVIILKSALFFNFDKKLYNKLNLENVDYLIGGEVEFIIDKLLSAHLENKQNLEKIEGISYKINNEWITNPVSHFEENLDAIPFPDRDLMNNEIYKNPLTNKPMATIATSRGCSAQCIYCLSPIISGVKVRFRSPQSVVDEMLECFEKYRISDFFFKSDTFTINKEWVIKLCDLIIDSPLYGKINWVANSRTNTVDDDILSKMKQAGCSLIAFGLESGSEDSLLKMKKGTTVELNRQAINLAKKHGIKTFGFYLIGFPWETKKHLNDTKDFMFEANTDFIEIHLLVPYEGCELFKMLENKGKSFNLLGEDNCKYHTNGTDYLSSEEIEAFKRSVTLKYYLRPKYIAKKFFSAEITPSLLLNYIKYGLRMCKNFLLPQ